MITFQTDFEPWLGYAIEGQAVGGIPLQNPLEGPQYHPQLHLLHSMTIFYYGKWWATHLQSFADLVFASERIDVGLKKGKFSHPAWTNEKTGANEEGEDEGEARAVTAIPIQPSFPPTQQCHYSANNKPSPYPPPSYPQRPSLNEKALEFTPIPVSYADLLPYLLDNSMVAITLAEAPGHSIEHCRGLKRKVQGLIDAGWLKLEKNRVNILPGDHNANLPLQMYRLVCAVMT
ncbi:hypothetical protein GmHk_01G001274 [Glycine max]|nr:hypothetical protein GmHk_01G001274 [Glycine max]